MSRFGFVPFVLFQPEMQSHAVPVAWFGLLFTGLRLAGLFGSRYGYRLISPKSLGTWLVAVPVTVAVLFVCVAISRTWWMAYTAMLLIALASACARPHLSHALNRLVSSKVRATLLSFQNLVMTLFIALMLCVIAMLATRNPQMVPGPLQNGVELVVQTLHDFLVDILGNKYGPRYVPFLGTLFVYILAMNLFGLIPFMDSPTSSLNVTVALALVVFIYSQYIGFRELGVVGWVDHMAGNPRSAIGWALVPLMLPIHLMGELAKPISLACRLFGNIFGEDMLLVAFASLGITVMGFTHLPLGLPLQLPFLFLALLTSTLQALVFTVLSTIYFLLMLPHDDHGDEAEGHTQSQHAH